MNKIRLNTYSKKDCLIFFSIKAESVFPRIRFSENPFSGILYAIKVWTVAILIPFFFIRFAAKFSSVFLSTSFFTTTLSMKHLFCSWDPFIITFLTEAAIQRCSWENVFWKHAANLQENTHVEVWFQQVALQLYWNCTSAWVHSASALLRIFSECLFLRTSLDGCSCS